LIVVEIDRAKGDDLDEVVDDALPSPRAESRKGAAGGRKLDLGEMLCHYGTVNK